MVEKRTVIMRHVTSFAMLSGPHTVNGTDVSNTGVQSEPERSRNRWKESLEGLTGRTHWQDPSERCSCGRENYKTVDTGQHDNPVSIASFIALTACPDTKPSVLRCTCVCVL